MSWSRAGVSGVRPFVLVVVMGCGKEQDTCSCFEPGITLSARKDAVLSVTTSGPGCSNVKVQCTDQVDHDAGFLSGCTQYSIQPSGAGTCTLHIETQGAAPRDETRQIADDPSDCCSRYHVTPDTASSIDVSG